MERWYGTFGIVEIDKECTWFLPADLEDKSDDEVMAAFKLTYNPPHPVDGGYGLRAIAEVRERLAGVLIARGLLREVEG